MRIKDETTITRRIGATGSTYLLDPISKTQTYLKTSFRRNIRRAGDNDWEWADGECVVNPLNGTVASGCMLLILPFLCALRS